MPRRSFLAAMVTTGSAAGAALLLAACGNDSSDASDSGDSGDDTSADGASNDSVAPGSDDTTDDGGTTPAGVYDIARRFPSTALVPGTVRLPISLGLNRELVFDENVAPAELHGRIADEGGTDVVTDLVATMRLANERNPEGQRSPYYVFFADLAETGVYTLFVEGASDQGAAFQVNDPATVAIPLVGDPLPPFDTPTVADHRGVEPICTHDPACELHDVTLTDALTTGKPVAYLIGTPAYCQTGVCGPILDLLIELRDEFGDDVTFVHADVYTDDTIQVPSPAVQAYGLDFEPVLFVTDETGILRHRLDAVFDQDEMREAIRSVLPA
jgi:hypothetical protein